MQSYIVAIFIVAVAWGTGWAVVFFGRRHGEPERKLRRLGLGFALGGLAFGAFGFAMDRSHRRTTLFEAVLADAPRGEVRTIDFDVEHPGVPHRLTILPHPESWTSASEPCELAVRWQDASGRVLLEEQLTLRLTRPRERMGAFRRIWESADWTVVPPSAGTHRVEFVLSNDEVASTFVRIDDPLKTDGVRAPGY